MTSLFDYNEYDLQDVLYFLYNNYMTRISYSTYIQLKIKV